MIRRGSRPPSSRAIARTPVATRTNAATLGTAADGTDIARAVLCTWRSLIDGSGPIPTVGRPFQDGFGPDIDPSVSQGGSVGRTDTTTGSARPRVEPPPQGKTTSHSANPYPRRNSRKSIETTTTAAVVSTASDVFGSISVTPIIP